MMAEQNGAIRILTALEAAERLRLTEDYEQPEDALAALLGLVRAEPDEPPPITLALAGRWAFNGQAPCDGEHMT